MQCLGSYYVRRVQICTDSGTGGATFFGGHPQIDWIKAHWKTLSWQDPFFSLVR